MPNIADNMNDWAYTFDPVSKKAWIEQIEKDLRGKPLDSLLGEWWSGETLQPIIHQEDASKSVVRLPDSLFNAPPQITECVVVNEDAAIEINTRILEALKFGAETILIQMNSLKDIPLDEWLKGVHLDMVNVQIQPKEFSPLDVKALNAFFSKGVKIRVVRNGHANSDLNKSIDKLKEAGIDLKSLRIIYDFPSTGIWDKNTISTLNLLLGDLHHWIESDLSHGDFFKQAVLKLDADQSYFKHIIQTRVLHLLWQNLMVKYKNNPGSSGDHYMECHVMDTNNENADHYLIKASMSGLAASLAGTQSLCIHHLGGENIKEFYKRTNRNIHHLLNLESNMYHEKDPLAGAYAVDQYTISWTKKIWEGLSL